MWKLTRHKFGEGRRFQMVNEGDEQLKLGNESSWLETHETEEKNL
jgi:hypothetical protein